MTDSSDLQEVGLDLMGLCANDEICVSNLGFSPITFLEDLFEQLDDGHFCHLHSDTSQELFLAWNTSKSLERL